MAEKGVLARDDISALCWLQGNLKQTTSHLWTPNLNLYEWIEQIGDRVFAAARSSDMLTGQELSPRAGDGGGGGGDNVRSTGSSIQILLPHLLADGPG